VPLIDPVLAELLVCPRCRGDLTEDLDQSALVCPLDGLLFPVVDGVPNMIIDE